MEGDKKKGKKEEKKKAPKTTHTGPEHRQREEAYRLEPKHTHTYTTPHNAAIHSACLVVSPYSARCQLKHEPDQTTPRPPYDPDS